MSRLTNNSQSISKLLKMPAFTLYGARGSSNADRVRLTLAEGGFTDYELVLLNLLKGEQRVSDSLSSEVVVLLPLYAGCLIKLQWLFPASHKS